MRHRPLSMLMAGSLVVAACGASGGADSTNTQPAGAPITLPRDKATEPATGNTTMSDGAGVEAPTNPTEAPPPTNLFPDVEVIEIATGEPVNLRSLGAVDRPVLLWFWAPH
ncbi:MAG: hypothetical protein GY929_10435 [Actinomycetia bacterium]|nr:hypothetical protein [Actinomycetes bacterium]